MLSIQPKQSLPSSKFYWSDIPSNVRTIIIDEMDAKTRCIFSICSKLCNEEAKKSKFYIYGLSLGNMLKISFDELENGYWLDFDDTSSTQTVVHYKCLRNGKLTVFSTIVENGEMEEVKMSYLNYFSVKYRKQLRFLGYKPCFDTIPSFTLKHLENLKRLEIFSSEWENLESVPFLYRNQILAIETIQLPSELELTSKDLFDFKGKNASVSVGDFDYENCKEYLQMLKNGDIAVDNMKISAKLLDNQELHNIGENLEISNYMKNEKDVQFSFNFNSKDRTYLLDYEKNVLKIETIAVFKKLNQFIFWPKLPLHVQELIIDYMDPKSRCRFAQCSKESEKEAKRSRNYLYKLGVCDFASDFGNLELQFSFSENSEKDFCFEFRDIFQCAHQTLVLYSTWKCGETIVKWTKVVEDSPAKQVRLVYLKEYLEKYKRSIKYFHFHDDASLLSAININHLKNLERIFIKEHDDCNYSDYFEFGYWQTIRRCKHVFLENSLSYEQFLDLDIVTAEIPCEDLQYDENLENYLDMLKNGKIHRNLESIQLFWGGKRTNFDRLGPFLKFEENDIFQKFCCRSNFRKNQIIEVVQKFKCSDCGVIVKCYNDPPV